MQMPKADTVRFGAKAVRHPDKPVRDYQEAFSALERLGTQSGKPTLEEAYGKLSNRYQRLIQQWLHEVSPQEVSRFSKTKKYGYLEESADVLFEFYTLQAIRRGLVRPESIENWASDFVPGKRGQKKFFTIFKELKNAIPPEDVQAFQALTGQSSDRARDMLALIWVKFALFRSQDENFNHMQQTRKRVMGEARELTEQLSKFSPARMQLMAKTWLAGRKAGYPQEYFRHSVMKFVQKRLGGNVQYDSLMQYVFIKQLGRQELDYEKPFFSYGERKKVLKPFELLHETILLKQAGVNP